MTGTTTHLRRRRWPVHAGPNRHSAAATFAALDALTGPLAGMVGALDDIARQADIDLAALVALDAAVDVLRTEVGARREEADIAAGLVARCELCGDVLWPEDMARHAEQVHQ